MLYVVASGCLTKQAMKRVLTVQLVIAIGKYEDGRHVGNPPDEVAQRIESCVVRPVNVLNHQNGRMRWPGQFGSQGSEHAVTVAAVRHRAAELGSHAPHQVTEGA